MSGASEQAVRRPPPLLLRGATLITLDPAARVLPGADLLVADGRIAGVGDGVVPPAGIRVLDLAGHFVLPGLVQGHLHLGQTLFRGLAEGRRLLPWLRERIWPLEAAHDDESAYWSGLLGAAECLLGGTTCVQDIGLGPGAAGLLQAIRESGLRGLAGMCLMDEGEGAPAGLLGDTEEVLAKTAELGSSIEAEKGRVRYVLNPRFILSCSDELWRGVVGLAEQRGWPIHTHALEQAEETALVRELKADRDEIEYFDDRGVLARDLSIAHGVWLAESHFPRVVGRRFSVVHCPSSNLKLGSGIANVCALRGAGIPVGIGADGAACNNALDAWEELRLAALLAQVKVGPGSLCGVDALRLATSEGARALGLEDEIGSIEVGKAADLVVLAADRPELWAGPAADVHDTLAFGGSRTAVKHVLVEGEMLVENGRLTRLDADALRAGARRSLDALVQRSGLSL